MLKDNNDSFKVEYMYDHSADIFGVKVRRDFSYYETIEIDEGIFLDFDESNAPAALEIHDLSKRLNLPKHSLKKIIFFNMNVTVNNKSISINTLFNVLIHDNEKIHKLESITSNNYNIPTIETQLFTA